MNPYERRTEAVQAELADSGADALICVPGRSLQYLTGFADEQRERHLFLLLPAVGDATFFAPELYESQLRSTTWVRELETWGDAADPVTALATLFDDLGIPAAPDLYVDDRMWVTFMQDLRAVRPGATIELASGVLADLRARKDDAELAALRTAARAADAAMERVRALGEDAIGLTEAELAGRIESFLTEAGGEGVSFETIVGSGPNGAMPHHTHGERRIAPGDPVVLDFGTRVDGYASDQTRTVVFDGDPGERFREVHAVVEKAQAAAVDTVAPGVTASAVDEAARSVIEDAGYGDAFVHRTGHGVGLDVHEAPYIVAGSDRTLEPGMVFSVEPGVYLDGAFGVRIEDLVVVTEDGCERLNRTTRGWELDAAAD
ncbi:M24 family metallopeptidase [Halobellus clavatus]|uniref:Xaa-Pro aminopeptidase n=1 Tax=Halobellus clavatus TaxID=660517 RepID=A0A1H3GXA0_9EURY|nr:Xaa-Pro peptidase family protein [Halobellus clavatus]SDY07861.1 Xaa-Pro aminopeptidase [Halobellus clavatus]